MTSRTGKLRIPALVVRRVAPALLSVLRRYDAAGGPLLAGGLAYSALFAMVPMTLLITGLVGLLVSDRATQNQVVASIADVVPPLRGLLEVVLGEAARSATTISLVGAATVIWGGSRFILAFETAMSLMMGGPRARGAIRRNVLGVGSAVLLVGTIMLGVLLAGAAAFLEVTAVPSATAALSLFTRLVLDLFPIILAIAVLGLVYRFVPETRPSWGAAWVPAIAVAAVLTFSARAFVFIAPRLIGAAATIGTLASVFVALAWLGLSFQAILFGAAWVGERVVARGSRSR